MEAVISNFWSVSGTVLLACFTAWLAWRHSQKIRRQSASDKFKATVLEQYKGLYPVANEWPEHSHDIVYLLQSRFSVVAAAVEEYGSLVQNKKCFFLAWDNFRRGNPDIALGEQDYFQYTGAYFDDETPPDPKLVFRNNLEKLLEFCE